MLLHAREKPVTTYEMCLEDKGSHVDVELADESHLHFAGVSVARADVIMWSVSVLTVRVFLQVYMQDSQFQAMTIFLRSRDSLISDLG